MLRAIACVLAVIALTAASAAQAAPALWVAKSPTTTIYLFGTFHILEPDAQWRTPALNDAFDRSTILWFETDITAAADPTTARDLVMRSGLDAAHPLSTKLDAEHLSELKAVMAHDQLPFDVIDKMRPWMASLMVMAAPMLRAGFDPKAGADVTLMNAAVAGHKSVRTFESVDQQLHFFADLAPDTELQLLEDTVDENARSTEDIRPMEAAWLAGDLDKLAPLLIGAMKKQYPGLFDVLITRRNQAWADALTKELGGHDVEMVNVGALHMLGDGGLPALLRARGFAVSRVQ